MAPIEEFTAMVEERTMSEVDALRVRAGLLVRAALGLMGLTVGLFVVALVLLQRRVARPVGELAAAASRAESALSVATSLNCNILIGFCE